MGGQICCQSSDQFASVDMQPVRQHKDVNKPCFVKLLCQALARFKTTDTIAKLDSRTLNLCVFKLDCCDNQRVIEDLSLIDFAGGRTAEEMGKRIGLPDLVEMTLFFENGGTPKEQDQLRCFT